MVCTMSKDSIYFGNGLSVKHVGPFESHILRDDCVIKIFKGREDSWQEAERYAMQHLLDERYKDA